MIYGIGRQKLNKIRNQNRLVRYVDVVLEFIKEQNHKV